jgi:hypothetical protein
MIDLCSTKLSVEIGHGHVWSFGSFVNLYSKSDWLPK